MSIPARLLRMAGALALSTTATVLAAAVDDRFAGADQVMLYVLAAALAGLWLGRGPAVLTAVANVAAFNWFFVEPRHTFAVADGRYVVTFAVMLAVALTIASLMASVRRRTRDAEAGERRASRLNAMSRELAAVADRAAMVGVAIRHVSDAFGAHVDVRDAGDERPVPAGAQSRVLEVSASSGARGALGTLVVVPATGAALASREDLALLDAFAAQLALALERAALAERAASARVAAETEALRSTLLASISHDLRTPLSVITAAGTALADESLTLDPDARRELARSIAERAVDVSRQVSDVLDLLRLEGGAVRLRRDWEAIDELVGLAVQRARSVFADRELRVAIDPVLPLAYVDASLVVQLLANLLENAARHTPSGTRVRVGATSGADHVRLVVEDDGPGLPPGDPERLFAKFERGVAAGEDGRGGAGLGLAICRAIAAAHGGAIRAERRDPRGARFVVTLPTTGGSP